MFKRNNFPFAGASALKQTVSSESAADLVAAVDEIAGMFEKARASAKK